MCRFKTQWNNRGHERATKPFTKERRRCVADLLAFTVKRWFKFRSWLRAAEPLFGLQTNIIYCCHRYKGSALTCFDMSNISNVNYHFFKGAQKHCYFAHHCNIFAFQDVSLNQTLAHCCRLHGHQSGCKRTHSKFKVHVAKVALSDNLADTEKRGQ